MSFGATESFASFGKSFEKIWWNIQFAYVFGDELIGADILSVST